MLATGHNQLTVVFQDRDQSGTFTKVLQFGSGESAALGRLLSKDPILYFLSGGDREEFLICAIQAGLSKLEKRERHTPGRISDWIDWSVDLDREELIEEILYTWARAKSKSDAVKALKTLDEVFGNEDGSPVPEGEDGPLSSDGAPTS